MVHRIYNGKELTEILGARLVSPDISQIAVKDILIDSRRLDHTRAVSFLCAGIKTE